MKRQDRRPMFSDRVVMFFSSFTCSVLRANFGARRKVGEFERLLVCARNSSGTLNVCSRLEVCEVARRYRQPLLKSEEYSEGIDAAARRCLDELPRRIAVQREHALS